MTSEEHNKYVAYSFFGYAAIQALMLGLTFLIMVVVFRSEPMPPSGFLAFISAIMLVFYTFFTMPAVIAGWAMLNRKEWSRTAAIIGAVVSAMSAPIGTAVTVYALWYFLGDEWKKIYPSPSARGTGAAPELEEWEEQSALDDLRRTEEWMRHPPDWR